MKSPSDPGFTVIDRRGQERVETEAPIIVEPEKPKTPVGSKRIWKSTAFLVVLNQAPGEGFVISGRAVGLREDGVLALADYAFAPIWKEGSDWTKEAQRRLNTWLGCDCKPMVMCETHKAIIPNWIREDNDRLSNVGRQPVPECVEVMAKAEHARKNAGIIIPR
jgi:hypothetical protein